MTTTQHRARRHLIAATAVPLLFLTACSSTDHTAAPTATSSTVQHPLQSPAAPSDQLISTGRHCFNGPTAVAAAHARASIALARENDKVAADAASAGQRPPYGFPALLSEPTSDNCYEIAGSGMR